MNVINDQDTVKGKVINYLVGALEASADHFGDAVHAVLGLLNDGVHFGEGGRLTHCRIFHGELQLLYVRRDLVNVVKQFFFQRPGRYLKHAQRLSMKWTQSPLAFPNMQQ